MDIRITSRHSKITPSLQDSVIADIESLEKFCDKATSCHVIIDNEHDDWMVEFVISLQKGQVTAKGSDKVLGKAVDLTLSKVERQLKKYNEKLKTHKAKKEIVIEDVSE